MSVGPGSGSGPADVGVVFVHGIGASRSGETLRSWSKPVLEQLGVSAEAVERVVLHESPAWLEAVANGRRIRFVESAWGELFEPPSYTSFVVWSVTAVPLTIIAWAFSGLGYAIIVLGSTELLLLRPARRMLRPRIQAALASPWRARAGGRRR